MNIVRDALNQFGLSEIDIEKISAAGDGKKLVSLAGHTIDEISANAQGLFNLKRRQMPQHRQHRRAGFENHQSG